MRITVRCYEKEDFYDPYRRWCGYATTTEVRVYHDGKLVHSEEFAWDKSHPAVKQYVQRAKEGKI